MTTYTLPLFPLNTVLYPGVPIFLHIFEDRYRKMVNRCVSERSPFGVVLIDEGAEAFGSATTHQMGCSAEIVNVQRMEDGRMNIAAVGQERFRILSTNTLEPYLQGDVEEMPLEISAPKLELAKMGNRLLPRVEQYVEALREISEVQVNWDGLPTDPIELAYLAAYVLQVGNEQKQMFLEADEASSLIKTIAREYNIELQVLRSMISQQQLHPTSAESMFCLN